MSDKLTDRPILIECEITASSAAFIPKGMKDASSPRICRTPRRRAVLNGSAAARGTIAGGGPGQRYPSRGPAGAGRGAVRVVPAAAVETPFSPTTDGNPQHAAAGIPDHRDDQDAVTMRLSSTFTASGRGQEQTGQGETIPLHKHRRAANTSRRRDRTAPSGVSFRRERRTSGVDNRRGLHAGSNSARGGELAGERTIASSGWSGVRMQRPWW